jgi:hypothetical protein
LLCCSTSLLFPSTQLPVANILAVNSM